MLYLKSVYILGHDVRRHFELQIPSFVLSHSIAGSSVPIAARKSGAAQRSVAGQERPTRQLDTIQSGKRAKKCTRAINKAL